jgi:hypothetical protein
MEGRIEWLDPLHQLAGQALTGRERMPGMSLFRIELGALAADLVGDVDEMRLNVEQVQFENGKQSTQARTIISTSVLIASLISTSFGSALKARRGFWLHLSWQRSGTSKQFSESNRRYRGAA